MILPVVLPDLDLEWAVYDGPDGLARARRGLLEPTGERLGLDAVATADVVLTPGLAVDRTGMRLGQGGGCYDRALGRVPVGTFTCTLLYDGELLDVVPLGRPRPAGDGRGHPVRRDPAAPALSLSRAQPSWAGRSVRVASVARSTARGLDTQGSVEPSTHSLVWSA